MTNSSTQSLLNHAPTGAVTISGTAKLGQTLTATNTLADADGLGAISYQWQVAGVSINGATSNTLLLTQAQVGKDITVTASYVDDQRTVESIQSATLFIPIDEALGDIASLSFLAGSTNESGEIYLKFDISLSSDFSNANSISLLYWAVNSEQTWITLTRSAISGSFERIIYLPSYIRAGTYEIRSVNAIDNTGVTVNFSSNQLVERGFGISTELVNPNSDNDIPQLEDITFGDTVTAADGSIHIPFNIAASDNGSGLKSNFVLELLSPTGASLQQWASLDSTGHASVDFSLSPYSADGIYTVNTVRLTDLAGNYNDSRSWLSINAKKVLVTNPLAD